MSGRSDARMFRRLEAPDARVDVRMLGRLGARTLGHLPLSFSILGGPKIKNPRPVLEYAPVSCILNSTVGGTVITLKNVHRSSKTSTGLGISLENVHRSSIFEMSTTKRVGGRKSGCAKRPLAKRVVEIRLPKTCGRRPLSAQNVWQ